jgi:hypothetical protein
VPSETPSEITLAALFAERREAEAAIRQLLDAGFDRSKISLLTPRDVGNPDPGPRAMVGTLAGGAAGAIVGALVAGGLVHVSNATLSLVSVLPVLLGVALGASTGMLLGQQIGAAASSKGSLYHADEVASGRSLVSVVSDRPDEVEALLKAAGGFDVSNMGSQGQAAEEVRPDRHGL